MQFIHSYIVPMFQLPGKDELLKHIELAGRVSYKSEDRIDEESAEKFYKMLMERGHLSPLEHGTVYLKIPHDLEEYTDWEILVQNPYTECIWDRDKRTWFVTTNMRVIVENKLEGLMKYACDPEEQHVKRYTVRIVCSRGVSHELVRHRAMSFTQESTRYCNYSKDKHGGRLTFIIPADVTDIDEGERFTEADLEADKIVQGILTGKHTQATYILVSSAVCAEKCYMQLLELGSTPQQARDVLTNGLKTEVVTTGTLPQWEAFLKLRSPMYGAKGVHPDMAAIADMIYSFFKDYKILK